MCVDVPDSELVDEVVGRGCGSCVGPLTGTGKIWWSRLKALENGSEYLLQGKIEVGKRLVLDGALLFRLTR